MSRLFVRVESPKDVNEFSTTWEVQTALTESTEYTATVSSVAAAVQVDGPRSTGTWRNASDGSSGTAPATAGNPLYETDGVQVAGNNLAQVLADIALALNAWWGDATNGASSTKRALNLVATVRGDELVFTTSTGVKISNMAEVTESGAFSVSTPVESDLGHIDENYYRLFSIARDTSTGIITAKSDSSTNITVNSKDTISLLRGTLGVDAEEVFSYTKP